LVSCAASQNGIDMQDANTILDFLQSRNSAPRLTEPGPSDAQLDDMLRCALRSPDHCWLRPWRFISISGERRSELGELMLASLLRRNPQADETARNKALAAPLRAPRMLIVLAALQDNAKVPHWEQQISAGCAAFSVLLAAEALGFGAVWRTGAVAEDAIFAGDLGAGANERIIGFIYLGTRDGARKSLPELEPSQFHRHWDGLA